MKLLFGLLLLLLAVRVTRKMFEVDTVPPKENAVSFVYMHYPTLVTMVTPTVGPYTFDSAIGGTWHLIGRKHVAGEESVARAARVAR